MKEERIETDLSEKILGMLSAISSGDGCKKLVGSSILRTISKKGTLVNGIFFASVAQAGTLLAGYSVNVCLARFLGPADYGDYGVVISIIVWMENILTAGFLTAAYKTICEHPGSVAHVTWTFGRFVAFFAVVLLGATVIASRSVATRLGGSHIALLLSIASIDLLFFGFYRLTLVVQNGLRLFHNQALIELTYAVGKVFAIILPVWWGLGVLGGLVGNIVASILALMLGLHLLYRIIRAAPEGTRETFDFRKALNIVPAVSIGSLAHTLYMSADLWMIKTYSGSILAGHYLAALTIAKLFLMATVPVRNVIMPFVAGAMKGEGVPGAKDSIRKILMLFFLIVLPALGIIFVLASPIMEYLFSAAYAPGASFLRVLAVGYIFLSLAQTLNIILISLDRSWLSCGIGMGFGLISLPLFSWSVQTFGPIGAAYTLAVISLAVVVCSALAIRQVFESL